MHFSPNITGMEAGVEKSVYRPGYGLDDPGFEARQGQGIYLFSKTSRQAL
jgi:hypothetical protein